MYTDIDKIKSDLKKGNFLGARQKFRLLHRYFFLTGKTYEPNPKSTK